MICKHKSTKLKSSMYSYASLKIQLNSHLLTQLKDQTVQFQLNQFSISNLFTLRSNVKQF